MAVQRIGVIGGGQLAWMLAQEAQRLGLEMGVQTPQADDPAVALAQQVVLAPVDSAPATAELAQSCGVITFENEFVDLAALAPLVQAGTCFYPSLASLAPLLDKLDQRTLLKDLDIPVPTFQAYSPGAPLSLPLPCVLKARRHGYDGQGTFVLKTQADWSAQQTRLGAGQWLVEEFIPFERELAIVAARNPQGEMRLYPVVETRQVDQVCRWVIAPAEVSAQVQRTIADYTQRILTALNFVGVLGIEFFLTPDQQVLVNELAPRTHNSGHYSLDACETSQFALQLQAITGLPLGSPALKISQAVMVNLLGYETAQNDYLPQRQALAALPHTIVHWYGKSDARPGRKLGHVTVLVDRTPPLTSTELQGLIAQVEGLWYPAP
ncbi:5-(carboxyamino)imidazole ribonucleotide synthase [Synechocystis sp. LKSZ1]|uniref:5-(carboxyamino)imidazole ribonucleotide synthase n=1 Tax=Synechocystis sp. LKSZ1 TaxID=3144951 RepID=UPI00336BF0F7